MESVLALAVISISSVGILSLVLSAQRATINAAQKQQAQLYAMDIINCYRADGTFERNVEFAFGLPDNSWSADWIDNQKSLTLSNNMTATLSINGNKLTVTILKDGKTLLAEADFAKGGTNEEPS